MVVIFYYPNSTSHLGLALTGLGEKNIYISFFPSNGASTAEFRLRTFERDKSAFDIEKITVLPSEESCGYGLSEKAIYDWWKNEFHPKNESFSWLFNNCSSVVYRALCAGQRSTSLENEIFPKSSGFCTPRKILSYAMKLGRKIFAKFSSNDTQKNLTDQFQYLKECCDHEKFVNPYDQAIRLYSRIKNLNNEKYSLVINKPYCDGVKKKS